MRYLTVSVRFDEGEPELTVWQWEKAQDGHVTMFRMFKGPEAGAVSYTLTKDGAALESIEILLECEPLAPEQEDGDIR